MIRICIAKRRARAAEIEAEEIAHALAIERNDIYSNKVRARIKAKNLAKLVRAQISHDVAKEVMEKGMLPVMALKVQCVWRGVLGRRAAEEAR